MCVKLMLLTFLPFFTMIWIYYQKRQWYWTGSQVSNPSPYLLSFTDCPLPGVLQISHLQYGLLEVPRNLAKSRLIGCAGILNWKFVSTYSVSCVLSYQWVTTNLPNFTSWPWKNYKVGCVHLLIMDSRNLNSLTWQLCHY